MVASKPCATRLCGRYDLSIVVRRESPLKHWFSKHVLRLYYPPSLVSRQSAVERWTATPVRHELPTLYHFDIHITDHCNLNCRGCGHFSNLCEPNFLDLDAFRTDMAAMAAKLRIEQIYLLGGEPLLHPQVSEFIREAREHFPETRIYVVTNGSLVMRQDDEFWRAMAETRTILMCDAYPIGLPVDAINLKAAGDGCRRRVDRGARAVLQGADRRDRLAGPGRLVPPLQRHQQLPDVQGRSAVPMRVHVLHRGVQGAVRDRRAALRCRPPTRSRSPRTTRRRSWSS